MSNITIDARMIRASGIGTVIENVLKRLIPMREDLQFHLIGNVEELDSLPLCHTTPVDSNPIVVPIYTIKEQVVMPGAIPSDTDLLWVPHYNIPLIYRGKMIVTIHDLAHLALPQFGRLDKRIYAQIMFHEAVKKAAHIVCVSHFTERELIKYTGVNQKKITVIYPGVDEDWYQVSVEPSPYQKPYILYVGNVKPHKNLKTLIQAFKMIKERIPHDLVIVGKKDGFITGDRNVCQLSGVLGDRVHFTGYVTRSELKQYYHHADLFVFPSLYEGFGLPPLEARAAGCKRIICSDIPVTREIWGNGVLYFQPEDVPDLARKIVEAVNSPTKGKAGMPLPCNWDEHVRQFDRILDSCLVQV
ncbi:glycosyltransferase family 4 protein [Dialister succinatiphilus]|uniref:glycosyltransferase family 4 protein n=1 Tax=Dialister succinatiphilus TaxID=487173 RepID=UPI00402619FC